MRTTRGALAILFAAVLGGVGGRARAADAPAPTPPAPTPPAAPAPRPPPTPAAAADAIVAAHAAGDRAALAALAAADAPDPWLVVDELLRRGAADAAAAFAPAAPRADVEGLPAYVAARRGVADDADRRARLDAANAALAAKDHARALAALGDPDPAPPADVVGVRLAYGRGLSWAHLGRDDEATAALLAVAEAAERLGWFARAQLAFANAGAVARRRSDHGRVAAVAEHLLRVARRRGDDVAAGLALWDLGAAAALLGDTATAVERLGESVAVLERTDARAELVRAITNLAYVRRTRGEPLLELALLERAAPLHEALGDTSATMDAWVGIGNIRLRQSDLAGARAAYERALALAEAKGDRRAVAAATNGLGNVQLDLGDVERALASFQRAMELQREVGDAVSATATLSNLAIVHATLGDWARAIAGFEDALAQSRARGDRAGAATALGNLGSLHTTLGDLARARKALERSVAEKEAVGDRWGAARTLGSLGALLLLEGDPPAALEVLRRSLAAQEAIGDRLGAARTAGAVGVALAEAGDRDGALAALRKALADREALGDRAGAADALVQLGRVHAARGEEKDAKATLERGIRAARSLRDTPVLVLGLRSLAKVHLDAGAPERALGRAREALREVETMLGDLGEEEGSSARAGHAELFEVGVLAAARSEDPGELLSFLESGRAGALLDTLGNRAKRRWRADALPEELRVADVEAQAAERAARQAYDRALAGDDRAAIVAASRALDAAADDVRAVQARIQRAEKRAAGLFYPRAKTLEEVRETLEPGDAFVSYALALDEALALVVTPDGERVVPLGSRADVERACAAFDGADASADPTAALAALRARLVEPLALGADVRRVVVSPDGPLCFVPFGAILDLPVALTPSGTTHGLLRGESRETGEGILALGDPDYGAAGGGEGSVFARGRPLARLPATRGEATRIGTVTLLGADATEDGLRATLGARPRWRAVHLACHGLVDLERPTLSSLALARGGEQDGFLTALEVVRMRVPADLVVLSACETSRGKVVRGEGILGLTRAFMYAGSPRVVCSLWKVDDAATAALMTAFYDLVRGGEGRPPLPTAEALRRAQAAVRAEPRWRHPYYWAAWVLWGLPT